MYTSRCFLSHLVTTRLKISFFHETVCWGDYRDLTEEFE